MHKKIFCLDITNYLKENKVKFEFFKIIKDFGNMGNTFIFTIEEENFIEDILYNEGLIEYVGTVCSYKETGKKEIISNIISSGKNKGDIYLVGEKADEELAKILSVRFINITDYEI